MVTTTLLPVLAICVMAPPVMLCTPLAKLESEHDWSLASKVALAVMAPTSMTKIARRNFCKSMPVLFTVPAAALLGRMLSTGLRAWVSCSVYMMNDLQERNQESGSGIRFRGRAIWLGSPDS